MENNELQKIWKNIDGEINMKSKKELDLLLTSKAKQTINKFLTITCTSIVTGFGLLIWLTVTAMNRPDDVIYQINNISLGIIAIVSFASASWTAYKLQSNKLDKPIKEWLEERIALLSKLLTGKFNRIYIVLIPVIYALMVLSIHVYFENKPFLEVLKTGESVIGLIVGAPIGLFVSFFAARKIRKYEIRTLEFLKDLHTRISF